MLECLNTLIPPSVISRRPVLQHRKWLLQHMELIARKPVFGGFANNKGTYQSDQRLCYSLIGNLQQAISKFSSQSLHVAEETGLSLALWETPKTGFVALRLISRQGRFMLSCVTEQAHCMCGSRGGHGVWTPLKYHKHIGFLSNSGPDPLKNHNATKPEFNVGLSSARQ